MYTLTPAPMRGVGALCAAISVCMRKKLCLNRIRPICGGFDVDGSGDQHQARGTRCGRGCPALSCRAAGAVVMRCVLLPPALSLDLVPSFNYCTAVEVKRHARACNESNSESSLAVVSGFIYLVLSRCVGGLDWGRVAMGCSFGSFYS